MSNEGEEKIYENIELIKELEDQEVIDLIFKLHEIGLQELSVLLQQVGINIEKILRLINQYKILLRRYNKLSIDYTRLQPFIDALIRTNQEKLELLNSNKYKENIYGEIKNQVSDFQNMLIIFSEDCDRGEASADLLEKVFYSNFYAIHAQYFLALKSLANKLIEFNQIARDKRMAS